jgi:lipopolysaccharide transport system ATP-binding protein
MSSAFIKLENVNVSGVDTLRRASSLRQWFIKRQTLRPVAIPILRDINFTAKAGDRVAFIGMNGSGKSSMLKVISGNYPVESGRREVQGTIVPLIEMGAGFESEITGRANIKLSFAYRGRLRDYSKQLEDQIIEFSELGDKIDLPLKTYSSGMCSRLAFSSAIFQDPEILLLDEVLAAGDAGFAEKSTRMLHSKIDRANITIIVSHSLDQVKEICNRFVLISQGRIVNDGKAADVIRQYQTEILHMADKAA